MTSDVVPQLSGWRVAKCVIEFGPSGTHCLLMLERGGPPRVIVLRGVTVLSAVALASLHGSAVSLVLREDAVDDIPARVVLQDASGVECLEAASCEEPALPWRSEDGPKPSEA